MSCFNTSSEVFNKDNSNLHFFKGVEDTAQTQHIVFCSLGSLEGNPHSYIIIVLKTNHHVMVSLQLFQGQISEAVTVVSSGSNLGLYF